MKLPPPKRAFTVLFNGITREIKTPVQVINPLANPPIVIGELRALWDSGATGSMINKNLIDKLGLKKINAGRIQGVHGIQLVDTYIVDLILPYNVKASTLEISGGDIGQTVDILIGMDIISRGDFALTIEKGKTVFSCCYPQLDSKIDFVPSAEKFNKQISKIDLQVNGRNKK